MKITKEQTAEIVIGAGVIALAITTIAFVKTHPIYAILAVVAVIATVVGYVMYKRNTPKV